MDKSPHDINREVSAAAKKLINRVSEPFVPMSRPKLKAQVETLLQKLRGAMCPKIFGESTGGGDLWREEVEISLRKAAVLLYDVLKDLLPKQGRDKKEATSLVCEFLAKLDSICGLLETDVKAAYEGDPAATSQTEVMLAYPAFEAISIYRVAHSLYEQGIRILPRMMTEYAHQTTGIDIHPGAEIGEYFFIDHGTGVVIGETTVIKNHVKLYQGVTLGAKSFELDERGNPIKGVKRHPDIGNNVIIYAGATILGGDTVVGDNSVIGSNVWLTHSVPPGSKVYYTPGGAGNSFGKNNSE